MCRNAVCAVDVQPRPLRRNTTLAPDTGWPKFRILIHQVTAAIAVYPGRREKSGPLQPASHCDVFRQPCCRQVAVLVGGNRGNHVGRTVKDIGGKRILAGKQHVPNPRAARSTRFSSDRQVPTIVQPWGNKRSASAAALYPIPKHTSFFVIGRAPVAILRERRDRPRQRHDRAPADRTWRYRQGVQAPRPP